MIATYCLRSVALEPIKLKLMRGENSVKLSARPQTPKEPFEYKIEEVLVNNLSAKFKLAGTLDYTKKC